MNPAESCSWPLTGDPERPFPGGVSVSLSPCDPAELDGQDAAVIKVRGTHPDGGHPHCGLLKANRTGAHGCAQKGSAKTQGGKTKQEHVRSTRLSKMTFFNKERKKIIQG